jgi:LuxR family maltose regulon positive regulatory protein
MGTPLLVTQLYVPPLRRDFVPRPRLLERLDEGLHCRLALVSAPAGFGKTTPLSEWLLTREQWRMEDGGPPSAAWLSLDAEDHELPRFLSHLIAVLATIDPETGKAARNLLRLPQLPPSETIMTTLILDGKGGVILT